MDEPDQSTNSASLEGGELGQPKKEANSMKKMLLSGAVVLSISVTWCGATQFRKSSLASGSGFFAPFFLVWFNTAWMTLCAPLFHASALLFRLLRSHCRRSCPDSTESASDTKEKEEKPRSDRMLYVVKVVGFTGLWVLANLTYCHALGVISATEVTALFASNIVFVYLLSFLLLKEPFYAIKGVAVVLAVCGIGMMAFSVGWSDGGKLVGIALAVLAAAIAAVYKVTYKKFSGLSGLEEVAGFLSALGLCDLILGAPIVAGLSISGLEQIDWSNIPWPVLSASAAFFLSFNFLVNFGISLTHPLTVAVGIFLGLPLNAILDAVIRGETLNSLKIGGSVSIVLAFILVLIPSEQFNAKMTELVENAKVKLKKKPMNSSSQKVQAGSCVVYIIPTDVNRIPVHNLKLTGGA